MEEKKFKLFREKSIELIESPEALNDYLQVTSPGVWIVLASIVFLLIGACIWGVFGHIDSTMKTAIVSDGTETIYLVPQEALESVISNRIVTVEDIDFELQPTVLNPVIISEETDVYLIIAGNFTVGDVVYEIPLTTSMEEGVYSGTIVTETLSPISLLMN